MGITDRIAGIGPVSTGIDREEEIGGKKKRQIEIFIISVRWKESHNW